MNDLFSNAGIEVIPTKRELDLPDAEIIVIDNFFSPTESDAYLNSLIGSVDWQQDEISMYGKTHKLPRLTAWYGDEGFSYTYSSIPMSPKPWSDELRAIKNRIEEEANVAFTSVLLNYYRDGSDCVSWHQDNERELGENPVIGSVSFGEARPFQIRHTNKKDLPKVDILLGNGSLFVARACMTALLNSGLTTSRIYATTRRRDHAFFMRSAVVARASERRRSPGTSSYSSSITYDDAFSSDMNLRSNA